MLTICFHPGPNTLTGHSSALLASENAINYSLRLIKPILDGDAVTVDVRSEAEARYKRKIQAALQDTVWLSGGCSNWYTGTLNGKKYNAVSYPWWQPHYWYSCLFPKWSDFEYTVSQALTQSHASRPNMHVLGRQLGNRDTGTRHRGAPRSLRRLWLSPVWHIRSSRERRRRVCESWLPCAGRISWFRVT